MTAVIASRRRSNPAIFLLFVGLLIFSSPADAKNRHPRPSLKGMSDDAFLDLISRKAFEFFWDNQNLRSGLFADHTASAYSNIAGSGFGLTALCIGAERGWAQKLTTTAFNYQGFYYHFLSLWDCSRAGASHVSTIDNALLLAGAITAGEYFGGEVRDIAQKIYQGMQWDAWVMPDPEAPDRPHLRMAWTPESGLTSSCWDFYSAINKLDPLC